MLLLDLFFPKYCVSCKNIGSYLCANCFAKLSFDTGTRCLVCKKQAVDGITHPNCNSAHAIAGTWASITYKGTAKKLIYTFKYQPFLKDLQSVLVDLFYEGIIQQEGFMRVLMQKPVLVPIPLHALRFRKRGYNQAELLAKGLCQKLGIPLERQLVRSVFTRTQVGLSLEQRARNIKGAFAVKGSVKGKIIVLVDDVVTTGATLKEATKTLKIAGAKRVYAITLTRD